VKVGVERENEQNRFEFGFRLKPFRDLPRDGA
jgi:hypothetical protein